MALFITREVLVNDEVSFAENANSVSSNTYDTRVPVEEATFEFTQERLPDLALQSRQNERQPGYLGTRECRITLRMPWYGHNSGATGALTETVLQSLLGDGLGGNDTTGTGVTSGSGAGTEGVGDFDAASTAGLIYLVGTKGDGGGDGQAVVVSNTTGDALTNMPAAPSSDQVYATQVAYPTETNPSVTKRFLLGFTTTNAQYHALGCQLESVSISTPIGGKPEVTLVYRGAYWDRGAETIPHGVTMPASNWAPVAGGSVFINSVGTATRATVTPSAIEFSVDMGLSPNVGPGGTGIYQYIVGWERTMAKPRLTMTIPWVTTYETIFDTDGSNTTHQHILITCNPTAGRSVGLYLPRAYVAGARPTFTDNSGLLYQTITWEGREGTTTTNDLTRSAFRLFMG